jgi:hypothetical protein
VLAAVRGAPAALRALRAVRRETAGDRAAAVLLAAVRGLPADRAEWGRAMRAELAGVTGARARWGFSLGCARAALALRARAGLTAPGRGGAAMRSLVLAAILAALALAAYGLVRYPGLRAGAWTSVAVFGALMLGYAWLALTLSRGAARPTAAARRYGLAGGVLVGAAWLLILAPATISKTLVFVPLAAALLGPACVAVLVRRAGGDVRAARDAALWSGLIGALLAFIVWVTVTYARDGRPYDAQMLRDFHASGSHDLAAYAVADDLGAALGLLVIVPVVALALGSLAGVVARARAAA